MEAIINFVIVLVVAVAVASSIGSLYAMGLRLWAQGYTDVEGNPHIAHRTGSVLCFAACVAIVLFALWLMIPLFH